MSTLSIADPQSVASVLEEVSAGARAAGRSQLLEHEALALLGALKFAVPPHAVVAGPEEVWTLDFDLLREDRGLVHGVKKARTDRVVIKALAADLAHKTELGAVVVTPRKPAEVAKAIDEMAERLAGVQVDGYMIAAFVEHDKEPGGELLLGVRNSREFGPLVSLGFGGVTAERLGRALGEGEGPVLFSPALLSRTGEVDRKQILDALGSRALGDLGTGTTRSRRGRAGLGDLATAIQNLVEFAAWAVPSQIEELEVNPLAFVDGTPWVLDALVRLRVESEVAQPKSAPRPLACAERLLAPKSIAIMGVSARKVNPARIILQNTLAAGFAREDLYVIRPGAAAKESIDGARCLPDLATLTGHLGGPVDMLVLAIPAERVPGVIEEVARNASANGIVLIPGGLGERAGTEHVTGELRALLAANRAKGLALSGPVVNGGNCLGVRSGPSRVDTLFIPHAKLPLASFEASCASNLALLSQSGAFAIARLSNLAHLAPRHVVTMGNQLDLTAADWLEVVSRDSAVRVFGCYVEGFADGDGLRFAEKTAELAGQGRLVILYRAGRTAAGAAASASHTASLAGDPVAARELIGAVGGLIAESIDEFEDLLGLATAWADRTVVGKRLGVISNAGFECVAVADNLGSLSLADMSDQTRASMEQLFEEAHLAGFVDVHHPLDTTPMASDSTFASAAKLLFADDGVDLGIVGCVPLTAALGTAEEDLGGEKPCVGDMFIELWKATQKAWCVTVDSGQLYDAFAAQLTSAGIPVFRAADRATKVIDRYASWRARFGQA